VENEAAAVCDFAVGFVLLREDIGARAVQTSGNRIQIGKLVEALLLDFQFGKEQKINADAGNQKDQGTDENIVHDGKWDQILMHGLG